MRATQDYTSKHYVRDNGFPLVWIVRLFMRRAQKGATEEADEHFENSNAQRRGKIIGRPAGPEAYTGKSAVRQRERESSKEARVQQKQHDEDDDDASTLVP